MLARESSPFRSTANASGMHAAYILSSILHVPQHRSQLFHWRAVGEKESEKKRERVETETVYKARIKGRCILGIKSRARKRGTITRRARMQWMRPGMNVTRNVLYYRERERNTWQRWLANGWKRTRNTWLLSPRLSWLPQDEKELFIVRISKICRSACLHPDEKASKRFAHLY